MGIPHDNALLTVSCIVPISTFQKWCSCRRDMSPEPVHPLLNRVLNAATMVLVSTYVHTRQSCTKFCVAPKWEHSPFSLMSGCHDAWSVLETTCLTAANGEMQFFPFLTSAFSIIMLHSSIVPEMTLRPLTSFSIEVIERCRTCCTVEPARHAQVWNFLQG